MLLSPALGWSYSGTIKKGRGRDLGCNYDVSKQSSSENVSEEGADGTSFCTLMHLLPCCLCFLSFRSCLIWWPWETGSRVLVLCHTGEPQHCRVGHQLFPCGQVSSAGDFWYLWDLVWRSMILVQQKLPWSLLHGGWAQHFLYWSGTGSTLVYTHSGRILKCISCLGLSEM